MNAEFNNKDRSAAIESPLAYLSQWSGYPKMHSSILALSILAGLAIGGKSAPESSHIADDSTISSEDVANAVLISDLPDDLSPVNKHIFDGSTENSVADTVANNTESEQDQRNNGEFNIPTNGPPSPLFGAEPFSQKMLRFEEFGPSEFERASAFAQPPSSTDTSHEPPVEKSAPNGESPDDFQFQPLFPPPTDYANDTLEHPWRLEIDSFIGRALDTPSAKGRPPGKVWAHQRREEAFPQTTFTTVTTGARVNGGVRDEHQSHGYVVGEFGPGGLYHAPAGEDGENGSAVGIPPRFHPRMPEQLPESLWTFDGTFPPKLLNVRYGEPVLMRHYNALPIDIAANRGFVMYTTTTNEHDGRNPAKSDGYTNASFIPGQFYDYRWPIALEGHDSVNTDASDPRAGTPDGLGGIRKIPGDWRQTMSTRWLHDHTLDFTAPNVYKGSAAMMNHYSALDRGNESMDDGVNLRLPSGSALDWGNRDYDVNLMLADKAWDDDGQLWFNPFNVSGFMGDVMTVNMRFKPYLDVRARRYRFRILNTSVSRYFKVALTDASGTPVPFHMVANDGNLMEHTVYSENGKLPTLGVAKRYDIVVDFSQYERGESLYFVNLLQHKNAQANDEPIPLNAVFSGEYAPQSVDDDADGVDDRWVGGDPLVGRFLEFRVQDYDGADQSMDPAAYVAGALAMIPVDRATEKELASPVNRTFELESLPTDKTPGVIETDDGKWFLVDRRRLSKAAQKISGGIQVWRIVNSVAWGDSVHVDFEQGVVLGSKGRDPPEWETWAHRYACRIGPQNDIGTSVEVALRFREFVGNHTEHCHNRQHEIHATLLHWIGVGETGPPLEPTTV